MLVLNVNCFQLKLGCGNLSLYVIFDKLSHATSLQRDSVEQCKMSEFALLQNSVQSGFPVEGKLQAVSRRMH